MPYITLKSRRWPIAENESVLDCLLRHGEDIPYSCKSGNCHSCLIKSVGGAPVKHAQRGLKATLQAQGYALACQWQPQDDVAVELPALTDVTVDATISELTWLNHRVMRVRLLVNELFEHVPGQYLVLINARGTTRSYSIANDFSKDRFIELHIRRVPQGLFSQWLCEQATVGEAVKLRGPAGNCFYVPAGDQSYPLVLAGTGTGLAPLYGIVNDALIRDHRGPITLYHGARSIDELYYVSELHQLARQYPQFNYIPCVKEAVNPARCNISAAVLKCCAGDLVNSRVYLCGGPNFVASLRKKIFLQGIKSGNIFCDAFIQRKIATVQPELV